MPYRLWRLPLPCMSAAVSPALSIRTVQAPAGGEIVVLRFERPEAMNAFSRALLSDLEAALKGPASGAATRALIVTGSGRAFSAGADLKERAGMSQPEVEVFLDRIGLLFRSIETLPIPTIAAINGYALGGGLELALCFDFRIAAESAQLGLTETSLGIIPGAGGTQRLPRTIGVPRAKELILTARRISAQTALAMDLVHNVVADSALEESALELAREITRNAPIALAQAKLAIDRGRHLDVEAALVVERKAYSKTLPTKDRAEALTAFAEKRPPVFNGE